jgi:hypothetical protein
MPNFNGLWTSRQQMQARGGNTWPSVPGAPTSPVATAGNMSASVAFVAPADTGFPAGITGYRVTSTPGGFTGTGLTSPVTVTGLTNGTAYTFTVAAQNVNGYGPESVASNSVTPVLPNYVEEVFSTWLYTGNGSTQTITNTINLSGQGGLVWIKDRNSGAKGHALFDTVRGVNKKLQTQSAGAEFSSPNQLTAFNSTGFDLGSSGDPNGSGTTYTSWTFREQPKFFDVVTWTGNNASNRAISHSLNSVPGSVIFKSTSDTQDWYVYHRTQPTKQWYLNQISGNENANDNFGSSAYTSTDIYVGGNMNISGRTYVAYIFAHNAGGFGLTGADNVITCDSLTTNGSGVFSVNLGYEPQWVLLKKATAGTAGNSDWFLLDNTRGWSNTNQVYLYPNTAGVEYNQSGSYVVPTATGFQSIQTGVLDSSSTYIYIAIRRGPMAVPTTGTSVFSPTIATTNIQSGTQLPSAGFPVDLQIGDWRNGNYGAYATDRLRGGRYNYLFNNGIEASSLFAFDSMTNVRGTGNFESSSNPFVFWQFRRAPGFFDEICYTGTGTVGQVVNHNLGVVPELVICVCRLVPPSYSQDYNYVYAASRGINATLGTNSSTYNGTSVGMFSAAPTATQLTLRNVGGDGLSINYASSTYVSYLFATAPGVSKVGSYTGTGATQTIACGFAAGARFVLIKRTDSTGDWYIWDSVRGMVSGTNPSLLLNTIAAEVNTNSVLAITTGFQIVSTASGINASGGTYIFLAIA